VGPGRRGRGGADRLLAELEAEEPFELRQRGVGAAVEDARDAHASAPAMFSRRSSMKTALGGGQVDLAQRELEDLGPGL